MYAVMRRTWEKGAVAEADDFTSPLRLIGKEKNLIERNPTLKARIDDWLKRTIPRPIASATWHNDRNQANSGGKSQVSEAFLAST